MYLWKEPERLLILSWYDHNGQNQTKTAEEFKTSRSHIQKLIHIRKTEGLGGLISPNNPGDLVVLDSIVEFIGPNFKKLYFVCCTDIATRIAFAMATETHNSKVPRELLQKMEDILQTPIKAVLTDNGSEFLAYFHKACTDQKIEHFFTRPRTPKDNAIAERFNETLQQGFYWRCDLTQPVYLINRLAY